MELQIGLNILTCGLIKIIPKLYLSWNVVKGIHTMVRELQEVQLLVAGLVLVGLVA